MEGELNIFTFDGVTDANGGFQEILCDVGEVSATNRYYFK